MNPLTNPPTEEPETITLTKLHRALLEQCRKITLGFKFEEKHRSFLAAHEDQYWVSAELGRLCFFDSARLDIIGYFGDDGWIHELGGYYKEVDGIAIKLLTEWMKGPVKLSSMPSVKLPSLEVIGGESCKITFPVHGAN